MKKVHDNVFYHAAADGLNVGCVIGEDAIVCIDLPFDAEEARNWRKQISELSRLPIRAVVFTASDRMSNEAVDAFNPPVIVTHSSTLAPVVVPEEPTSLLFYDVLPVNLPTSGLESKPRIALSDALSIVLEGKHTLFIDITFQGGYSPDACFVTIRDSGIVFTGDHVAVDQPPNLTMGQFDRWLEVLTELKKNRLVSVVVPGRGPASECAKAAEATMDFIKTAMTRVKALLRAQRPPSELGALVPELMAKYAPQAARNPDSPEYALLSREMRAGLEHLYDTLRQGAAGK
jgi:glyoxylase-like metal-dependent hydrolase (beta-lactamase superfamily II)